MSKTPAVLRTYRLRQETLERIDRLAETLQSSKAGVISYAVQQLEESLDGEDAVLEERLVLRKAPR